MKRLLEVQKQIGTLSKSAKNPFFKSQYLDLTTLIEHVTPLLNEQGLVLLQPLSGDTVTSAIVDGETGEAIASSSLTLTPMTNAQQMGGQITYYRRYTLKSLLAIAEVDDDGNLASKPSKPLPSANLTACEAIKQARNKTTLDALKTMFNVTAEQETKYLKLLKDGSK